VHFTGKVCDMSALMALAEEHGIPVVEDAAQAFGAAYYDRPAGSFGVVGCFSMNPMKVFGACGNAGMIVTDREDLRRRLETLRQSGMIDRETCAEVSFNARMDTLQAAILLQRLDHVAEIIERRREIAAWYGERLSGVVELPRERTGERDVYYTYTIRAERRDRLRAFLMERGVETQVQHRTLTLHQAPYRRFAAGTYPVARRLVERILCIPANEKVTRDQVDYVAACIRDFYQQ
jgi:dTDP-4-amino-4,6-dideoxygalactose transaminase